jgi:hypothetical protein
MADFNSIENFVNAYIDNGSPYYVLAVGNDIKIRNPKNGEILSIEEASQVLTQTLERYVNSPDNHRNIFKLYIFEDLPKSRLTFMTAKKEADTVISLHMPSTENYVSKYYNSGNSEILAELKALRMKVETMEGTDEEEEEPNNPFIGALTSNPELMNTLILTAVSAITGIISKFSQPTINKMNPTINGINTDEPTEQQKIDKAIEVLAQSTPNLGDSLLILAKMSIDNPQQYKFLLGMLK